MSNDCATGEMLSIKADKGISTPISLSLGGFAEREKGRLVWTTRGSVAFLSRSSRIPDYILWEKTHNREVFGADPERCLEEEWGLILGSPLDRLEDVSASLWGIVIAEGRPAISFSVSRNLTMWDPRRRSCLEGSPSVGSVAESAR